MSLRWRVGVYRWCYDKQTTLNNDVRANYCTRLKIRKTKSFQELASPMISANSAIRRWSVIKRRTSIVPQVIFDPRKTFKTAITCVRFLVRLKHIRTTPVLLSLEQTRVKPYTMRNYRQSIDRQAFGLYNHWIKKDQAQDRAAVFQTSPKRDMKTKNKSSSF